jgi:hypothetical protein
LSVIAQGSKEESEVARQPTATAKRPRTATRKPARRKPQKQSPAKLREAEKQELARAKELEELYRPLREAAEAELQKTKSGRKLLEDIQGFAREFGEPGKGMTDRDTPSEEAGLRLRERLDDFHRRSGDQFVDAHARHVQLQPSAQAVAQILRPEMAMQTVWVSETSPSGSMLLQPKATPIDPGAVVEGPMATPADAGTVTEGLGAPPPPIVHSCASPAYGREDEHMTSAVIWSPYKPHAANAFPDQGKTEIGGNCYSTIFIQIDGHFSSAFVGQDFPVPPGPTSYEASISYDWRCSGTAAVCLGVAVVNVDLAIVIDKLDGTRETHAREVSLFTVPVGGMDWFHHASNDASVTIPFTRDGLNATTRIMVGADGHCITAVWGGYADFTAEAVIREICLTSTA